MQKITPCLWFDDKAEEAAKFYVSIFKNSKLGQISRYGEARAKVSGRPKGSIMTVTFEIDGQEFVALNGGPLFTFTEAVSFMVKGDKVGNSFIDHSMRKRKLHYAIYGHRQSYEGFRSRRDAESSTVD